MRGDLLFFKPKSIYYSTKSYFSVPNRTFNVQFMQFMQTKKEYRS